MSKDEALRKLLSRKGAKVRIRRDSQFAHQNDGVGEVIRDRQNGWVTVKFENGKEDGYRYDGDGKCDLELANPHKDLFEAVKRNESDKIKLLIETEVVDVNAKDINGRRPIHEAASFGCLNSIDVLVENGADINLQDYSGATALHIAAQSNLPETTQTFLGLGADISIKNNDGKTALDVARDPEIIKLFEKHRSKNVPSVNDLVTAVQNEDVAEVQKLIEAGVDVNGSKKDGYDDDKFSPLNYAVSFKRGISSKPEIVKLLLIAGAEVNIKTKSTGWTPLHYAVYHNDLPVIEMLLEAGADVELKSSGSGSHPNMTALEVVKIENLSNACKLIEEHQAKSVPNVKELFMAIGKKDKDEVKRLIAAGVDVNVHVQNLEDLNYWAPIDRAIEADNKEIVQLLLDAGADVNMQDPTGWNAVFFAVQQRREDCLKLMLDHGVVDFGIKLENETLKEYAEGRSDSRIIKMIEEYEVKAVPSVDDLIRAVQLDNKNEVKKLIEAGVNINERYTDGWNAMHYAVTRRQDNTTDIVQMLIDAGADLNIPISNGKTIMELASDWGTDEVKEILMKHNPEPPIIQLMRAVATTDIDGVEKLIDAGVDVNEQVDNGTCLHLAAHTGSVVVTQKLLEAGAVVDPPSDIESPLMVAVASGKPHVARIFLQNGADLDAKDVYGKTSLGYAIVLKDQGMVELLIDHGADVNALDRDGWTPLHLASEMGTPEICKSLIDAGAYINAQGNWGYTPLHLAAAWNKPENVQFLLTTGADTNVVDHEGKTALDFAKERNFEWISKMFEDSQPLTSSKLFRTISEAAHRGMIAGTVSGGSNFVINQVDKMLGYPKFLRLGVSRAGVKALLGMSFMGLTKKYADQIPNPEVVQQASVLLLEAGAEEGVDEVCELVEPILVEFMSDICAIEPGEEQELLEGKSDDEDL